MSYFVKQYDGGGLLVCEAQDGSFPLIGLVSWGTVTVAFRTMLLVFTPKCLNSMTGSNIIQSTNPNACMFSIFHINFFYPPRYCCRLRNPFVSTEAPINTQKILTNRLVISIVYMFFKI